ncbi:MAG: methyltransferase domain-containing protein [Acidobacteriota bacterium]|nr:methyltransferase domain-containing protein [Acidobacteriota bacterium]
MLEWTGERFLPWIEDATIAYEHLHRYAFASQFVEGKRVLDLATGEGYGASLLSRRATSVTGIDLDEATIHHASNKYDRPNLSFMVGDITQVPILDSQHFDIIVCFETIEHIAKHGLLLDEIKRLLIKDGLLIISTPNKTVYTEESGVDNPFHINELDLQSLSRLLDQHFKKTYLLGQRVVYNSNIWPIPTKTMEEEREITTHLVEKQSEFTLAKIDQRIPRYFIAIATNGSFTSNPQESILVDMSDALIKQSRAHTHSLEKELKTRADHAGQLDDHIRSQEKSLSRQAEQVQSLEKELKIRADHTIQLDDHIRSQEKSLSSRAEQVQSLEKELKIRADHTIQLDDHIRAMKNDPAWKVLNALSKILIPKNSRRRNLYDRWKNS